MFSKACWGPKTELIFFLLQRLWRLFIAMKISVCWPLTFRTSGGHYSDEEVEMKEIQTAQLEEESVQDESR